MLFKTCKLDAHDQDLCHYEMPENATSIPAYQVNIPKIPFLKSFLGYDRWLSNPRNLECNMEISSNNDSLYSSYCNHIRYKGAVWAFYTDNDNRLVSIFTVTITNIQLKVQYLED